MYAHHRVYTVINPKKKNKSQQKNRLKTKNIAFIVQQKSFCDSTATAFFFVSKNS